jgi:hypothetical protein
MDRSCGVYKGLVWGKLQKNPKGKNSFMNVLLNLDILILIATTLVGISLCLFIMRNSWRQYGLLFLLSAVVATVLCLLFVSLGLYSFPVRIFPEAWPMPVTVITTVFPMLVLVGVRYSPKRWPWKIPFYWGIIHLGMLAETWALNRTQLIEYNYKWDFWDSYTWWWIFLLLFEWVGGQVVSPENRRPIRASSFYYGRWAWAVFHFIVIITIFLGGFYFGRMSK